MGIAYGIDIAPHDDPYVSLAEKALQAVESASTTGWTFDMLPFCRSLMTLVVSSLRKHDSADMHLPWWFPGASFKKEAEQWAPHVDELVNKPYQTVKDALVRPFCLFQSYVLLTARVQANGTAVPSIAASMIGRLCEKSPCEEVLTSKAVPATIYIGECLRVFFFHSVVLLDIPSGGADTVCPIFSACEII